MKRRNFIKASAAVASTPFIANATGIKRVFKVAIVGCGYRGNDAALNITTAAKFAGCDIKFTAAADFFLDKAVKAAKKWNFEEKFCFDGACGYKKIFELDDANKPDIVLLTTPLSFRAVHFAAAVKAGVHVFAEKGVAVDPLTVRLFLETAKEAAAKKLTVVAGTQRRHQRGYRLQAMALQKGIVKPVVGGVVHWNEAVPWIRRRTPDMSNKAYLCNNWLNFSELSGDHVCEQHVHNIDVANWFIGRYPKTVFAFGGRARRQTGNQYDFFSADLDYGDGVHIHSMCRQIAKCYSFVGENFTTVDGRMRGGTGKYIELGKVKSLEELAPDTPEAVPSGNPFVWEQYDLLRSIMGTGPYFNEAENVAMSTACAIMIRLSAYTGQIIRMHDILENKDSQFYNMNCSPSPYDFEADGDVEMPKYSDDKYPLPPILG